MDKAELYMQRCLDLAQLGLGKVAPNPMVGAVLVYDEKIIGEGYHQKYGESHAEVNAINNAIENNNLKYLSQSTLYVNLEPCTHFGKTPPCADLIIQHKIPRVVIGCQDIFSEVNGKGIKRLKEYGIEVLRILEEECKFLNRRFLTFHEKRRPYIILKWAQTLNGYIGKYETKGIYWISNAFSRKIVHKWRSEEQSVFIGTNTALHDNPKLSVRDWIGKSPIRIFLDKNLKISSNAHLLDQSIPTIIFTLKDKTSKNNLEYIQLSPGQDLIEQIFEVLYKKNIQSVLVEGGQYLINSLIQKNLWDEARIFISTSTLENGIKAPVIEGILISKETINEDTLYVYQN